MPLKSYDPKAGTSSFAGILLTGFSDGTFLNVAMNEEAFTLKKGAQGESGRAKKNDQSARFTFTLMQTSICNDLLSAKHNADLLDPLGVAGVGPFVYKDGSGRTVITAESAWIVKFPDMDFSNEIEDREWIIETDEAYIIAGGN